MIGYLRNVVDEIDVQAEKIRRIIANAAKDDPELAAGFGTSENLGLVQRKLDKAAAACEQLDDHVKLVLRNTR